MSQLSMDSFVVVSKKAPRVMPGRKGRKKKKPGKGGRPKGKSSGQLVMHTPLKRALRAPF